MHGASSTVQVHPKSWRKHASIVVAFHIAIAVGGVMLARLLGSVTQVALARLMGVADFGTYTTLYTLLAPVVMVTSMGLDTWLLHQGGRSVSIDTAISQVFALRLLATAGLMAVAVAVLWASGRTGVMLPMILAALGLTSELLLTTAHTALRAQIRNIAAALLQVAVAGITIALIWLAWDPRQPLLVATGYRLVADAIGLVLLLWLLHRSLRLMIWRPAQLWGMIRQARAYFATDLLASVALKADLTLVALLLGTLGAGIYGPALTIINTTFLVPAVAWQVLLPLVTRQKVGSRSFRWTISLTLAGSITYGIAWALTLAVGSPFIIELVFRGQYDGAAPLLQIMSVIPLLKSINFCWAMLMVARDNQVLRTKLLAVGAAVNVGANLVCIPLFGLVGAAWVNVLTEVVLLVCYSYGAWRSLHQLHQ